MIVNSATINSDECKNCHTKFSRSCSLKKHVKSQICKKTDKNETRDDSNRYTVICLYCSTMFKNLSSLIKHFNESYYDCKNCDEKFSRLRLLKKGVKSHFRKKTKESKTFDDPKNFSIICLNCLIIFDNHHSLKNHFNGSYSKVYWLLMIDLRLSFLFANSAI